jgi:hypothetical protein
MAVEVPVAVHVLLRRDTLFVPPGMLLSEDVVGWPAHGQRVALADARIGGRRRLRAKARQLGLHVEEEYAVLPTWERATFIVQDRGPALRWFFTAVATVPPGLARGAAVVDLALRWATATRAVRLAGHVVPGRLLIARRV